MDPTCSHLKIITNLLAAQKNWTLLCPLVDGVAESGQHNQCQQHQQRGEDAIDEQDDEQAQIIAGREDRNDFQSELSNLNLRKCCRLYFTRGPMATSPGGSPNLAGRKNRFQG
jgi:hypothetical protein